MWRAESMWLSLIESKESPGDEIWLVRMPFGEFPWPSSKAGWRTWRQKWSEWMNLDLVLALPTQYRASQWRASSIPAVSLNTLVHSSFQTDSCIIFPDDCFFPLQSPFASSLLPGRISWSHLSRRARSSDMAKRARLWREGAMLWGRFHRGLGAWPQPYPKVLQWRQSDLMLLACDQFLTHSNQHGKPVTHPQTWAPGPSVHSLFLVNFWAVWISSLAAPVTASYAVRPLWVEIMAFSFLFPSSGLLSFSQVIVNIKVYALGRILKIKLQKPCR
jgi:hypothetical protein